MAPLSLKIVKDDGAVTRKVKLDPDVKVWEAHKIVQEKFLMPDDVKDNYGLFLRSPDNELSGIWLEPQRNLSYYMLRNEDRLDYMSRIRNLRVRMLDDTVKTLQVDQSKTVSDLMISICGRIGITNPEEYGLCLDSEEESDESKENKPSSGTLTLKKKSQLKDRDFEFEQLSKKLKTDDNVEWVDLHKTLSEACIEPRRTLLLKRRLFYSDRNVDSRDPVQLNLLYVQARDNILNAVHPVTEEKAAEFAGIQCQIHFGDFQEDKHKPGFLENLNEYLPEQYSNSWGIEKKILKEYRKHQGVSPLDAKYLYTKTARAMPTYGVTFFLVKEKQKDKKKLVPRLLGINAQSVLRLDERSKEVLQAWPLTHVKTYHAGKGETFTLNFGDYSDKEYSVKTRDAYRIRDILEGYIDIIRRRMLTAYNSGGGDSGVIGEENMSASSASVMQHVSHNSSQQIEHSIVGPTRIVPHEPGQQASGGTQIVTVQEIITTHRAGNQQTAVTSDVPMRSDMSMSFTRRLNRLNSNAVKVVSFLTEHGDVDQARKQVLTMLEDMPVVRNGVKETIERQSTDDARKKLEEQLHELEELLKTLDECTTSDTLDKDEAVDAAKNIADVTTQMYFSMDPKTKGRSQLLRNSRASFIEDERTEKSLRRASFIAATATAVHSLDQATAAIQQKYTGDKLSGDQVPATEKSAVDNLAKLNAAIAHYLMAHSDPKTVDYGTAVTSMNTIHEFIPELVNDVKALAETKDQETRRKMLADLKALCEQTRAVCATLGCEDPQKIQEVSKAYSDISNKLIFAFGRSSPADKFKKDKVMDLAKDVQNQAEGLVKTTFPLVRENTSLQLAGDGLNSAATRLVDQAELTASTLHEPHCQSALTAAAESVSSSAQHFTAQCRPLLEDQPQLADALHQRLMALAQALDALKANYVNDDSDYQNMSPGEIQRLKFIKSASAASKQLVEAEKKLNTALPSAVNSAEVAAAQGRLARGLARLNAAVAALVAATADRENPDYATAELAINTISELMPGIVHDSKVSNFDKDAANRAAMLEHVSALCAATGALCHADVYQTKDSIGDAVDKFKDASAKLVYVVRQHVNPEKEQEIVQLAAEACGGTSELLCGVQQLAEDVGGEVGEQLDAHGAQLADAAQQLLTLAQVTAPSICDRRCQSVLLAAADKVADSSRQLADCWAPLSKDKRHEQRLHQLQQARAQLLQQLDKLRAACHSAGNDAAPTKHSSQEQRLKFMKSNAGAQQQMKKTLDDLNKPPKPGSAAACPRLLAQRLDALTAALVLLMQATRDAENPNYEIAEQQVKIISELMPQVVQDTKSASSSKDVKSRSAMLEDIRALCEATDALCQYSDGRHPQELSEAVSKYSVSSGKLVFTLTPARDLDKGQQVVELSAGSCATTSELLCGVQQLAEDVGGEVGEQLDAHGAQLADAAQQLLTLAQVTAPSICDRRCQSVLLAAADKVTDSSRQLADCWAPLSVDKRHEQRLHQLQQAQAQLQQQLDKLRAACHSANDDMAATKHSSQEQRLKFMKSNAGAQQQMKQALDDLNKPPKPGSAAACPRLLAQRLDALTAALALLMQATRDAENPDYETAERQVKIISELMPQIVKDTKSVSASKDAESRAAMMHQIRDLCEAANALCQYTDGTHPQELSEAVSKLSASSGKLVFTLTPTRDQHQGQKVVELSAGSCATTSELLCGVQQLAEDVGGEVGEQLDAHGAQLADAAQQLLTLAQVTAPSICDRRCQSVLLAAADKVADSSRQLADCWAPLSKDERHKNRLHQLQDAQARLQQQLDKLRNACHAAVEDASSLDIGPSGKLGKPRPAVPKRASSVMKPSEIDFTKQFLDNLRCEESRAAEEHEKKLKLEQEKTQREQFVATVDEVHQHLLKTEHDLKQWCKCPSAAAAGGGERARARQQVRRALAQAAVHVAHLVAANYANKMDYPNASKSTAELPKLVTEIVKDGKVLSGLMKDTARQEFLNDMLQLCESSRSICDAAKNHRQRLNQSAMVFGDNSTKLLYAVSDDVDPDVEKEIISRAKAIGDSASRLSLEAVEEAGRRAPCPALIAAGTRCVDAAGKLVYTAKLVAPSIHELPCQEALVTSAASLSLALEQFSSSSRPLAREDNTQHLYKEADNLNRILEGLMSDIKGGNIGKRREMEKLVIEDTPLRMLTLDIIEAAKQLSTSVEPAPALQQQHQQYWRRVSDALRHVDVAHARANNTPDDAAKCSELERAVQHLQMVLLTSRPNAGNRNAGNIVDLRDYIEEVSSEAQKLADVIDSVKVDAYDKKTLQDIKASCEKMATEAYKLTHPDGETGYDTTFNDILDVDTFGQDCEEVIKEIDASLRRIQDDRLKKQLLAKLLPLTDTCNMMRFATKSGMSASTCASLESTLSDLDDIEARVIPSLVKEKHDQGHVTLVVAGAGAGGRGAAAAALTAAARDVTAGAPRAALTAYVAACAAAASTDRDRNKLLEHLYRVAALWRRRALCAARRRAAWQPLDHPHLTRVTQQLIQEIQNPESEFSASPTQSPLNKLLDESDINRLLLPGEAKVLFTPKKQGEQLAHMSSKLGSISNNIQSSVASPQSLARSAKETVNTACELAALARGCKNVKDPLKSEQIEESVQRMTFATYNLLKVAEQSTADPNNANVRRRLQDACYNLNDAIGKLVLTSSPAAPIQKECRALSLALQATGPAPGPAPGAYRPPPAPPSDGDDVSPNAHTMSYQSATDALYEEQHVLNRMNDEQLQCRLQFAKTLGEVAGAVRRGSSYAVQCAYLLSISESDKEVAKKGVVDVPRLERTISRLQDSCINIIGSIDIEGAKEETTQLEDRLSEFSLCMEQASNMCSPDARPVVERVKGNVCSQGEGVARALQSGDMEKVLEETVQLLDVLNYAYSTIEKCPLLPVAENISKETRDRCDEVISHSKTLVDTTIALVKEVESREQTETMTWTTFSTSRNKLLNAYDNLLKAIKVNGQRAGILEEPAEEDKDESDAQQKTYLETQVDIANRWLTRPMCKDNIKTAGHQAVQNIIDIGRKMSEELSGSDREEMRSLVMETEELLLQCSTTRDIDKYRALSESVKEMKKLVQRGVVTKVVEDLVDVGTPLEDLDILTDTEPDATKRKYILERKIAELLSQLGRVTRTARVVALTHPDDGPLHDCTKQAELLAPKLVQAAERRVNNPNDEEAIEKYKALVLEYAESIARVREMCDKSVDPMEFVQTAGDMMQRLRAESTSTVDPQKSTQASQAIIRLANRTIEVSLSSPGSKSDPELQAALVQARARLQAAAPAGTRASRIHDIHASTDEIIRTTNEVESALGGENIFNKRPTEFNQKIFTVALGLRESVAGWSSRDNDVVAAARRLAVLMAHLSEHMHTDNKRALILTSKKIVIEAQEVTELAKKLANECTDVRIKNNLLQTCERIPTISHQLKMLTTVKSSSLGNQGTEEDKAAMDMLVGNAQSLMLSVQEVVKAAAGASVKIMSQRGARLRWVRKTYY